MVSRGDGGWRGGERAGWTISDGSLIYILAVLIVE